MTSKRAFIIFTVLIFIFLTASEFAKAQKEPEATGDEKIAKQFFLFGDYYTALKEYSFLYSKDTANQDYWYPLGVSYANTNIDKQKAIPLLEKVVELEDFDAEAMYQLGIAYQVSHRFEEAIECFEKFKKLIGTGKDLNYISADREIEMCNNAMELIKKPVSVTFENVGARINSPYPDYNPYVNRKETEMYFSSKRTGNIGNLVDYDGYNTADVFISENKYGVWGKSKRLVTTINTPLVEETCGLSADGSYLFMFIDNLDVKVQACMSVKEGRSFSKLRALGSNVNQSKASASAVTITSDKKIIFFAIAAEGGQGGSDIYMSKLLPTGQWGPAENIGDEINTQYDEDFPYLAPDGKTLYFASTGHNSMGGFDIFSTTWDKANNTFSEPVNIGFPVNTPEDNTVISFTGSGRYAYTSALRKDSYGNLDIYRLIFNKVKPGYTSVIGNLAEQDSVDIFEVFRKTIKSDIDSLKIITDTTYMSLHAISDSLGKVFVARLKKAEEKYEKGPEISIKVSDNLSKQISGTYKPNKVTGKFIIILPPGEFLISIVCEGYQELNEVIKIDDRETPMTEITRTFRLNKK